MWVGIIAIKTERTLIHFLSDVLIAVASLNLARNVRSFIILPSGKGFTKLMFFNKNNRANFLV